jgi:hypothetical protein
MALVDLTNLNFDEIKTSIKAYLRANSNFTDYDFEGSNLSVILDVLAYNTYITSYNANMVGNEVFIDSATLRENVVSLARNIGYVPKSKTASKTIVTFGVDTSSFVTQPLTLTLKKGTVAVSKETFGNQNYTFMIPEDITVPVVEQYAQFNNIEIYEGSYAVSTFTVNTALEDQRFILDNEDIDTTTLSLKVRPSQSSTVVSKFSAVESILNVKSNSKIFFIQEVADQRYELLFGDGIFGEKLSNGNYIEVSYCITNGEDGNGITNLDFSGRIIDNNDRIITTGVTEIFVEASSQGGQEIQSTNSVRKYAPRLYASQNRAVTASDYEALIPTIYPEAEYVTVFGGEDLSPPQFGKVYIVIKPYNGQFISNAIKSNLKQTLKKYSVSGVKVEFVDLKYVYVETDSKIYYNQNKAPSAQYVKTIVSDNINQYSRSREINQYGSKFKYSKFLKIVDDSHESITSNITTVQIRRNLKPVINSLAEYEICYGNSFYVRFDKAKNTSSISQTEDTAMNCDGYNIKSSGFNVEGFADTVYISDFPHFDGKSGEIFLFRLDSESQPNIIRRNVGTVHYDKGEILLKPIKIISTLKNFGGESIIEISATPLSNDVVGLQDLFLQYEISRSTIDMVPDVITSGYDPSALSHKSSSSYVNGSLIRN